MPNRDGTGIDGKGCGTGRGLGRLNKNSENNENSNEYGRPRRFNGNRERRSPRRSN